MQENEWMILSAAIRSLGEDLSFNVFWPAAGTERCRVYAQQLKMMHEMPFWDVGMAFGSVDSSRRTGEGAEKS
jgi:hypothetical protein